MDVDQKEIDSSPTVDSVEQEMRRECCVIGLCVYNNEPGLPSVLSNIVKITITIPFPNVLYLNHSPWFV